MSIARSGSLQSGWRARPGCGTGLQFLHHRFAHFKFLDLPGNSHGEVFNDLYDLGDLEVRDSTLAKLSNFLGIEGTASRHLDPSVHLLSVSSVWHAKNLHAANARAGVQELLDFSRVNVLASADDYILCPTCDGAVTFFLEDSKIAGVQPTVVVYRRPCRFVVFVIPLHDVVSAGTQLPMLAGRNNIAGSRIDYLQFGVRQNLANGSDAAFDRVIRSSL